MSAPANVKIGFRDRAGLRLVSPDVIEVLTMRFLTRLICVLLLAAVPAAPAPAAALTHSRSGPAAAVFTPAPEPSGLGLQLLDIPAALEDDPREKRPDRLGRR